MNQGIIPSDYAGAVSLVARVCELEEEVRQLRLTLAPQVAWPSEWRLSPSHATVLSVLAAREVATHEMIYTALYWDDEDGGPGQHMLAVHICHLRKKVAPHGVEIESIWGRGYRLTPAARAICECHINAGGTHVQAQ